MYLFGNPKYIFLDVDGVLNNLISERFNGINVIEEKLLLLKRLVDSTDAEIILTSSWRDSYDSREDLGKAFSYFGLTYRNYTPDYHGEKTRGEEISAWLSIQSQIAEINYVILDDLPPEQFIKHKKHFVNVNFKTGLTDEDVDAAIEILNKDLL